jgi:hypothetical protein
MNERWQQDWITFAETVAEHLRVGDSPEMLARHFGGKTVTWKGTLDEKSIDELAQLVGVGMTTMKLDLGGGRSAVLDGVSLPIAKDTIDLWRSLEIGSSVTFTATLGSTLSLFPPVEAKHLKTGESVLMIRLSDGRPV